MPESPHNFIKQHALRDWVVKWSFGPPKPEKTAIGTTDGYRYSIIKHAAGPKEAVRLWRERTLPKFAPVTNREPLVHKVYIYTGTLGEARRIIEAEDPKRFLRQVSADRDSYRNGAVTGDAPVPVREAEDAKSILRQATASRAKMIHCFKDFHFLRSVPRPAPPAMLTALHALQSEECEMEAHVFTVLDLQAGYAFHQSARCIDPTHFRTERLWKSACGRALVAKIR